MKDESISTEEQVTNALYRDYSEFKKVLYDDICANAARQVLGIPQKLVPYSMIAIGYPAENPAPKDKYTEDNVIRIE